MTIPRWLHGSLWALAGCAALAAWLLLPSSPALGRALLVAFAGSAVNATLAWLIRKPLGQSWPWLGFLFLWMMALLLLTNALGVGKVQVPRALFALASLLPLWRALLVGAVRKPIAAWLKNASLMLTMTLSLLVLAEAACMFVAYTVGPARSLSSQLWYAWHHRPLNSMGYRDVEYVKGNPNKKVLVIGDSFAAGQGVNRAEDRFPDLLRASLPPGWALANLSQPGATTFSEWENYQRFPDSAEVLVLSYLTNDIEHAAAEAGHVFSPRDMASYPEAVRYVTHHSYCINLAYSLTPYTTDFGYGEYLKGMYADTLTWHHHFAELRQFTDDSQRRKVPLLVLLWPDLVEPSRSAEHLAKVKAFLEAQGTETLDLTPVVESVPPGQRVVNRNDAHPGEAMHAAVAQAVKTWAHWPR